MAVTFMRRPNLWIVVVVERKIEIFKVAFTADGKHYTQGDISLNKEINSRQVQVLQSTCYGLNWSTGNYDLFCVDTARKTNTTRESASDAEN